MSAARYKLNGYDCGMEAAHDGAWVSHFDYAQREAMHLDICRVAGELTDTLASKDTALAEIRAERDAFEKDCEYWSSETARVCGEASTLAAELALVKKALEPFANYIADAKGLADHVTISNGSRFARLQLTVGDCRAASRALSQDGRETRAPVESGDKP